MMRGWRGESFSIIYSATLDTIVQPFKCCKCILFCHNYCMHLLKNDPDDRLSRPVIGMVPVLLLLQYFSIYFECLNMLIMYFLVQLRRHCFWIHFFCYLLFYECCFDAGALPASGLTWWIIYFGCNHVYIGQALHNRAQGRPII